MRALIPLLFLVALGCEPPKPRPQVALPPPVVTVEEQQAAAVEPEVPGPPTAADLAAAAPAAAEEVDQRLRQVVTALEQCQTALTELNAASEPAVRDRRLAELRDSCAGLASEAQGLRDRAAAMRDTGQRLRALGGG